MHSNESKDKGHSYLLSIFFLHFFPISTHLVGTKSFGSKDRESPTVDVAMTSA